MACFACEWRLLQNNCFRTWIVLECRKYRNSKVWPKRMAEESSCCKSYIGLKYLRNKFWLFALSPVGINLYGIEWGRNYKLWLSGEGWFLFSPEFLRWGRNESRRNHGSFAWSCVKETLLKSKKQNSTVCWNWNCTDIKPNFIFLFLKNYNYRKTGLHEDGERQFSIE